MDKEPNNNDPYSISLVAFELKMRSGTERVIHSYTQKQLMRLGDGVAIAIVKILDRDQLRNPGTIKVLLSIIRDAFSTPELIVMDANKSPNVTLLLLEYLGYTISDVDLLHDIKETKQFVRVKTND